ncbi:MAG: tetraacyldisaccharide 4'-kinase [Proteobacteria bacterium]|nr:tetraacyldisaccharide 4'-kinase [Pseudomonadota bacterium]
MRPPEFWHGGSSIAPRLLAPLSAAYAALGEVRRRAVTPWHAPVPVICVGNLTVGGAGKTPVALALGGHLLARGRRVAYVTRGYGGQAPGPLAVDPARHTARAVGDEPLLLAARAPTYVARDRRAGARAAIAGGADLVILDDGLQNPMLHKDLSLVVVDGGYGFGNGRVLPGGPLREPIAAGLARAGAIVLVGADERDVGATLAAPVPLLRARLAPDAAAAALRGKPVYAFAGIGRPAKFYRTLEEIGATLVARRDFADHHAYTVDDIMRLVEDAARMGAQPVTTVKDHVRLPDAARPLVTAVRVELVFDDPAALDRVLGPILERRHG